MKHAAAFISLLLMLTPAYGFEGNDDNITRDYYVQLYQSQDYIPDFKTTFRSESDRRDYKKVREYLNNKEEIFRLLRMAGDEYYYGLSFSKLYETDYIQSLKDEVQVRDPEERVLVRINSVRPYFSYHGEYSVAHIESEILPSIIARYKEAEETDRQNEAAYKQIQKNMEALQMDIFQAEQAIFFSLSPEFRDQDFRKWISLTFSGLIAVLMFSFFWIIYRRSDASLPGLMFGSSGLQFITVFILIIAIILFGILKVLGGSELAAILSGISGYILGKGNGSRPVKEDDGDDNGNPPREVFPDPGLPAPEPQVSYTRQEEVPEDDSGKYLPGENY